MIRRVITIGIVVFTVYVLVTDPGGAGSIARNALSGLQQAGNSLAHFLEGL